jgi:tetratricopeptide (TPR) repeat protein
MGEQEPEMRPYRTVLEQKIRERRQTFEEFVAYVETFAREHNEPGTLSVRHLQRLVAGRRSDGRPLGPVQPVTARLLEHILGSSIDELLAPPATATEEADSDVVLRQWLYASRQVDKPLIVTLQDQLAGIRRLDRQLGAVVAHDEVRTKIDQVTTLLAHSISNAVRELLAALLSELYCLAGWQALDLGKPAESWRYYNHANAAALESGVQSFKALAEAGRAFVLVDIGDTASAVEILASARATAEQKCPTLLRSWLAAAHGETLAANGRSTESLRAFDAASTLLPADTTDAGGPYVALNPVHLARWRGYALAQCGESGAVDMLIGALDGLDPTFTRAETALRVDLATALASVSEYEEARAQTEHARSLAEQIGSTRQRRRASAVVRQFGL